MTEQVRYADVEAAAERLEGVANRTPVATSRTLDERLGASLFLKCESFQRAGAFKFRGAYNALSIHREANPDQPVVTFSSGNHAQAVALAGSLLGIETTIVMPKDAPAVKLAATRGYGAEVVLYDRAEEDREAKAHELAAEQEAAVLPAYDDARIIAGQGTAARELFQKVGPLDLLVVCCGGGGVLAGSALAARALSPGCRVIGVEPAAGDDGVRSFQSGELVSVHDPQTIADGARTPSLGLLNFAVIKESVADMVSVEDNELIEALRFAWERLKLVVEPTGVLGLAALLCGRIEVPAGSRVGVIVTGGNVDVAKVAQWIAERPETD